MDRAHALAKDGFAVLPNVVDEPTVHGLITAVEQAAGEPSVSRNPTPYGTRNLLGTIPAVRALAASPTLRRLVEPILGRACFAVRGLYFDKLPEANWKVPWHQDLTIAVRTRKDVQGFGPWTEKAGVPHAQAPVSLLERMLAVRVHLDDCGRENGPLRVLPGTHRCGRLDVAETTRLRAEIAEVVCEVGLGGVLLMRPLLLHASSPADVPQHRRVLHLEYAAETLPGGLEWYETVKD